MITKNKLAKLIEPHFENDLVQDIYEIKTIKAKELLTNSRLDLAFKLLYLEMMGKDVRFAKEIYKEHIRALSLGMFTEPGNKEKNSIDKFVEDFHKTFKDIKVNKFDSSKTLIPLSKNNSIANGAHRVASAIYLDKDVECVKIDTFNHVYDYKFFYKRNISTTILDIVVSKFIKYASNIHVAFVWPTACKKDAELESIIPNIVYRKDVTFNAIGAHNLLSQVYYGEIWLGNIENNFRGSQDKLLECFKSFAPVRIIAFQAGNLDEVLKIKENIRSLFNIGKHSVHITDTKEEAIQSAQLIFNDNSIHFLNHAKPNKFLSVHKQIKNFKHFIQQNNLDSNKLILDSSIVLSVYGLRKAKDIDFVYLEDQNYSATQNNINTHDEELIFHKIEKAELILNPKYYFYFNKLKFVSFNQIYIMKKNRSEEKDINDCNMMQSFIEKKIIKENINKLKQILYYEKIKLRQNIVNFLKRVKMYDLSKKLYYSLKALK